MLRLFSAPQPTRTLWIFDQFHLEKNFKKTQLVRLVSVLNSKVKRLKPVHPINRTEIQKKIIIRRRIEDRDFISVGCWGHVSVSVISNENHRPFQFAKTL